MARDLKLSITGESADARKALDSSAKAVDRLGDQAKQLGRTFTTVTYAAGKFGREIDNIGDQARQSARAVDHLGDELSKLNRKSIVGGGAGGVFGAVAKDAAVEGERAASTFASAFQGGILEAFKGLPPEAKGAIAAGVGTAVFAVAPFIGATISAAVIGSVGAGGLVGGIVLAAQDARVKAAFTKFADVAKTTLTDSAGSFVDPLVEAAHLFTDSFRDPAVAGQLKEIFSDLSKAVGPLARGLAGLVKEALPGLRDAARAAVPLFQALGKELPGLGKAASDFFSSVARGGPGAAHALQDILHVTEGILVVFGRWIEDASKVYEGLRRISGTKFIEETFGKAAAEAQVMSAATDDAAASFRAAADATQTFSDRLTDLINQSTSAVDAAVGYKQAIADLTASIKENGRHWDINSEKGRANVTAFEDVINQAARVRQSMIDSGLATAAADEEFRRAAEAAIAMARAAGATQAQIDFLTGSLRALLALPNEKTFRVRVIQTGSVSNAGVISTGDIRRPGAAYASGTPYVPSDRWAMVGERGPELVGLPRGASVLNARETARRMTGGGTRSSSGGGVTVNFTGTASEFDRFMSSWFMKQVQIGAIQLSTT